MSMNKQERIELICSNYMVSDFFGVIDEVEIPSLAEQCNVSVTTIKKDLKELNCSIYQRKRPKIKDLSKYEDIVESLPLKIARRMPKYAQRKSVRENIGRNQWSKVRDIMLEKHNCSCSVCGFKPEETKYLHVHEHWDYDEEKHILKLIGLSLLCSYCHSFQHFDYTIMNKINREKMSEEIPKLHMHFMKVNQCTQDVLQTSLQIASRPFDNEIDIVLKLDIEKRKDYLDKRRKLENEEWSYWICEDMPIRDEVIATLKNKGKAVVNE